MRPVRPDPVGPQAACVGSAQRGCRGPHGSGGPVAFRRGGGDRRVHHETGGRVAVLATPTARGYLPGGGSMALTPKQRKHLEARLLAERTRGADRPGGDNSAPRDTVQQEPGDRGTDTANEDEDVVNAARET